MYDDEAHTTRATMTLGAGTILHHGTSAEFEDDEIEGPCWFSRSRDVAERFAGQDGRVISFSLDQPIDLPMISGREDFAEFCEEHWIRPYSAEDMAEGVMRAGLPGWITPDNYPGGDDILLVDVSQLCLQHQDDRDGTCHALPRHAERPGVPEMID